MNKEELIREVAKSSGISSKAAKSAIDTVFVSIERTLRKGDKAAFVGFGTFSTAIRTAREGRNPITGATIKIAAKTMIKFKAGKALESKIISSSYEPFEESDSSFKSSEEKKTIDKLIVTNEIESPLEEQSIAPAILVRVEETINYMNEVYDKTNQVIDHSLAEIKELSNWLKALKI